MPPRPLSYHVVRRKLLGAGFSEISSSGSHVKFVRGPAHAVVVVIVPRHQQIAVGTLRSIIRGTGLTVENLQSLSD